MLEHRLLSTCLFLSCLVPGVARADPAVYVVREGDYLAKLAQAFGFDAAELWNHPENARLKGRRDPNLLHPGDILRVPRAAPRLVATTGTVGGGTRGHTTVIQLSFSEGDKPRANQPYKVEGLATPVEGLTDAKGSLSVEVPVELREFRLSFSNIVYPVLIGNMEPVTEPSGARKRLAHMGYRPGSTDQEDGDDRDRRAIEAFQRASELEVTGVLDEATMVALVIAHGS
jgi:hypothetical protein